MMHASNNSQTKVNLRTKPQKEEAWSQMFDVSSLHQSTKERNNGLITSKGVLMLIIIIIITGFSFNLINNKVLFGFRLGLWLF